MTGIVTPKARLNPLLAALFAVMLIATLVAQGTATDGDASPPVLLIGLGLHVEPFGATVSPIAVNAGATERSPRSQQMDYHRRANFERHAENLRLLADLVEQREGAMTIQVQSPFTMSAARFGSAILSDLEARGHEIALHFHEDTHLGGGCRDLPVSVWSAVMKEEIDLIHSAGVTGPIRYWSGGNSYTGILDAASTAGLMINSDWKDAATQSTPKLLMGIHPWRPAGGVNEGNVRAFAQHDPSGEIVFLPGGLFDPVAFANKRQIVAEEGEEGWLRVIERSLLDSVAAARPDRVNVFHFTLHPGEMVGDPADPYAALERFFTVVVDPLVEAGVVQWATFGEMADAFTAWESANPDVPPRLNSNTPRSTFEF